MKLIKIKTTSVKDEDIEIVYKLVFKNALYSLECYKDGSSLYDPNSYTFVENITEDEGEADTFLKRIEKGRVFPVHIKDLIEDYFK